MHVCLCHSSQLQGLFYVSYVLLPPTFRLNTHYISYISISHAIRQTLQLMCSYTGLRVLYMYCRCNMLPCVPNCCKLFYHVIHLFQLPSSVSPKDVFFCVDSTLSVSEASKPCKFIVCKIVQRIPWPHVANKASEIASESLFFSQSTTSDCWLQQHPVSTNCSQLGWRNQYWADWYLAVFV